MADSLSDINVILFDIGDTILRPKRTFNEAILEEFDTIARTETVNYYDHNLSMAMKDNPINPELTWCDDHSIDTALERLYHKALGDDVKESTEVAKYLTKYIRKPEAWDVIHEDTVSILSYLSKHYCLGVISNWGTNLEEILEHNNIRSFFDIVICSAEVGVAKPNIEVFKVALSRLKEIDQSVMPFNIAYVGDSIQQDIIPACSMGIQPIYLNEKSPDKEIQEAIHIKALDELLYYF